MQFNWLTQLRQGRLTTRRRKTQKDIPAPRQTEKLEQRTLLTVSSLFVANGLIIESTGTDNITVDVDVLSNVRVTVNGSPDLTLPVIPASVLQSLLILGSDSDNVIDVSGVTAAAFTFADPVTGAGLSIEIDADDGDDTIISSLDIATNIDAGDGDDTVTAGNAGDTIDAGDGDDSIIGGAGNDGIIAGDGQDTVVGNAGNDTVDGGNGNDSINGNAGLDSLTGGHGADTIAGDADNDFVDGGLGDDSLDGNDGDDVVIGNVGDDTANGGLGDDTLDGQAGSDVLFGNDGNDLITGGKKGDVIDGGLGDDFIIGDEGDDVIRGDAGNDTILGGGGADLLDGGTNDDSIFGQAGRDTLIGATGADSLNGGTGNDLIQSVLPGIVIGNATNLLAEGPAGTTSILTFQVGLTQSLAETITVDFTTADDTAMVSDLDYVPVSGRLTFAPGVTMQTISVSVNGDDTIEMDEQFFVNLSNASNNVLIETAQGIGFIPNDDMPPVPVSQYDITVNFTGGLTPSQQAVFTTAAARISQFIVGDVPDVMDPMLGFVDDVVIDASGVPIDGVNGILGQAGPTRFRPVTSIPFAGMMQFDTADLAALEMNGTLQDVIIHEMMHVIGVGTLWSILGLIANSGSADPRFTGPMATAEYNVRFMNADPDIPIEVAVEGHWRENIFMNELMTPFLDPGVNPVSRMTVAQFADLGYIVDLNAADPYLQSPNVSLPPTGPRIDPGIVTRPVATYGLTPLQALLDLQGDTIDGGAGNDTIVSGDGNDLIIGSTGNDNVRTGGGNDFIQGGGGDDTLNGEGGDDTVIGHGGADLLTGSDGNDEYIWRGVGDGNDTLLAAFGNDLLSVNLNSASNVLNIGQNSDGDILVNESNRTITVRHFIQGGVVNLVVNAGQGDDVINITDVDKVGLTSFTINGETGNDTILATNAKLGRVRLTMDGGDGNDFITGTASGETIVGGQGDDVINGGDGNDNLQGGDGVDVLNGNAGDDILDGGAGNDFLNGDAGNDILLGGLDDDVLDGQDGDDSLFGGFGNDFLNGNMGNDNLMGQSGEDTLVGAAGDDTLDGGRNNDLLLGNSGDDKIRGDHGNDFIRGQGGNDTISGGDGADTIFGEDGNDGIAANDGDDYVDAGNGDDTVTGNDGADTLFGGAGRDIVSGGDGDDFVIGNAGFDTLLGGQGNDTFDVIATSAELDEAFVFSLAILANLNAS